MRLRRDDEPDRVRRYTTERQLRAIEQRLERSVRLYAGQSPEMIDERIRELRCEWSIERFLQLNVAAVGLSTALLAATRHRSWGVATCLSIGFFLVHAIDGFDPPLLLLRKLGVRTRSEIDREIFALKAIRGDFNEVAPRSEPLERPEVEAALSAVGV